MEPMEQMFGVRCRPDNLGMLELAGNYLHCFGSDKADSYKAMTGMTSAGWYGNEITLHHPNTIQEAFSRTSIEGAKIFWDTNPDYPEHPIKLDYIDKDGERLHNGRLRIRAYHFRLDDNPYLSRDYIDNLKASIPSGMWYDRRIKGLWVAAEGVVFEDWDYNVNVIEPFDIPAEWTRVRGIDWGYENPFVCLWGAVDGDGRLYIYREHYQAHTLIKDHAEVINRHEKVSWTVADHDAQDIAEIRQYGIYANKAQKDVAVGLQKVAARLKVQRDGKPRLFVFSTCPNTRREMGLYRWAEHKEGKPVKEEPLKVNDHCPDTIRYMCMGIDNRGFVFV